MLDKIVQRKRLELETIMSKVPLPELLKSQARDPGPSFRAAVTRTDINIIAEIKYRSPSRGSFPQPLLPQEIARLYEENGAAAISVLTEKHFFEGDLKYISTIRKQKIELPLLRKDFIFDPYQVLEARVHGASAYLLIASCLSQNQLKTLIRVGDDFELEALVEVHDPFDLEKAMESGARFIGINNRDLKTFRVDIETSFRLARFLEGEPGFVLVSESGIRYYQQLMELRDAGFSAFLVGSLLMESPNPGTSLRELLGKTSGMEKKKESGQDFQK